MDPLKPADVIIPDADVSTLKPMLEAIVDLNRLKQLNLNASLAPSFRAFQHELEA